jgi:hypothetical protein
MRVVGLYEVASSARAPPPAVTASRGGSVAEAETVSRVESVAGSVSSHAGAVAMELAVVTPAPPPSR